MFKSKLKPDGSLDHRQARLIAKEYHQVDGIDYFETFSCVIKPRTICIVISLALVCHWEIRQLDVQNAFLDGVITEDIHPGLVDPTHPNYVCKLEKALYGLKQVPRAWFDRFSSFIIQFGFYCSLADPSLFIYHSSRGILVLLLYVDDMLPTGSSA